MGPHRSRARHQGAAALPGLGRGRLVQGHCRRGVAEPLVHGGLPPRQGAHPLRRPHLPDGLRGDDRRAREERRRVDHRRHAGAVGRDPPLRRHGHRPVRVDHGVPGEGPGRAVQPGVDGDLRVLLRRPGRGAQGRRRDAEGFRLRPERHSRHDRAAQAVVLPVRRLLAGRRHAQVLPRGEHGLPGRGVGPRPGRLADLHQPRREGAGRPPATPPRPARPGDPRPGRPRLRHRG